MLDKQNLNKKVKFREDIEKKDRSNSGNNALTDRNKENLFRTSKEEKQIEKMRLLYIKKHKNRSLFCFETHGNKDAIISYDSDTIIQNDFILRLKRSSRLVPEKVENEELLTIKNEKKEKKEKMDNNDKIRMKGRKGFISKNYQIKNPKFEKGLNNKKDGNFTHFQGRLRNIFSFTKISSLEIKNNSTSNLAQKKFDYITFKGENYSNSGYPIVSYSPYRMNSNKTSTIRKFNNPETKGGKVELGDKILKNYLKFFIHSSNVRNKIKIIKIKNKVEKIEKWYKTLF